MKDDIKKLSDIECDARLLYESLGMMNSCWRTHEQTKKALADYRVAEHNWLVADRNLRNAVEV